MKKILCLLLVGLMVCAVLAGGCGGDGKSNNFAATSGEQNTETDTDDDNNSGRNNGGDFLDTDFDALNGEWRLFSGVYNCYSDNHVVGARLSSVYGSFQPSDTIKITANPDGTLLISNPSNPSSFPYEVSARFLNPNTGVQSGQIGLLRIGVYTLKSDGYYETTGDDGDVYQITLEGDYPYPYFSVIHAHKDNNGTEWSNYSTFARFTNTSAEFDNFDDDNED